MTDALSSRARSSRERLNRLLALAARGADGRAALLDDLVDLLADWPADYAQAMRATFETLFEKTAREADPATRTRLAQRLADAACVPVELLNDFYFEADAATRARILARNACADDADGGAQAADG